MSYAVIGAVIIAIASIGAFFILKSKAADQPKPVKIVFFGLYFWGLVFLQIMLWALAYYFNTR